MSKAETKKEDDSDWKAAAE